MKGIELWHNKLNSWHKEIKVPSEDLPEDTIIVKSLFSMVSNGTETLVLSDNLDTITSSKMKLHYMKGDFSADFTYGYSLVGQVLHGKPSLIGKNVHLLHPHQSYAITDIADAFILPDNIGLKEATLISSLETVVNAIWDSKVSMGDSILIVGYGLIGALLSFVLERFPGINVTVHELDKSRSQFAKTKFELLNDSNSKRKFDCVFHTSCTQEGLQTGIDRLEKEGSLIELSWFGSAKQTISLGSSFHYDRKRIISSQVGSIPGDKSFKWSHNKRKELVVKLLREIDFSPFLENIVHFGNAPKFYNNLRENRVKEIGTIFQY